MANETKLVYELSAEISKLQRGLSRAESRLQKSQRQTGMISKRIATGIAAAFSIEAIRRFGQELIRTTEDYDKQAKAIAQVEQAIISTGGIANKSLQELRKTAEELQKNTLFGDEEILVGATAQLLTFTNIANDQFDRVQQSVLDVSTRLGQDLKSTAIQLGKALNDPVANLGALGRSGIQFSKDQKAVIKSLAETNQLAEAQAMILTELEAQYGGSAEAAAQAGTGGWKQLANTFGDLREEIGRFIAENSASKGLAKFLKDTTESIGRTTRALNSNLTGWQKFKMLASNAIAKATGGVSGYSRALEGLGNAMEDNAEQQRSDEAQQKAVEVARVKATQAIRDQARAFRELQETRKAEMIENRTGAGVSVDMANTTNSIRTELTNINTLTDEAQASLYNKWTAIAQMNEQMGQLMKQTAANALGAFAEGLGFGGIENAFASLSQVFANGLSQIGDSLIAYGVSMLAAKAALSNPFTAPGAAIAAGVAAKLFAGAIRSSTSGMLSQGSGGGGSGSGRGFSQNLEGQSLSLSPKPIEVRFQNGSLVGMLEFEQNRRARTR